MGLLTRGILSSKTQTPAYANCSGSSDTYHEGEHGHVSARRFISRPGCFRGLQSPDRHLRAPRERYSLYHFRWPGQFCVRRRYFAFPLPHFEGRVAQSIACSTIAGGIYAEVREGRPDTDMGDNTLRQGDRFNIHVSGTLRQGEAESGTLGIRHLSH